jgi:uncharacterized protein YraI
MYLPAQFRSARLLAILLALLIILSSLTVAAAQAAPTTIIPTEGVLAVNVRSGPGTEYTVRFALNAGQTLVATGRTETAACSGNAETDGWVRITVSETIEGWVSLCAVTVSGDVDALPVAEPAFPQLITDTEPLELLEGSSSFANPDMVAATNAAVVMRSEPWLGSEALGIVPANAAVELIQVTTDVGWVQASYGEATGWLPGMTVDASEIQLRAIPTMVIGTAAPTLSQDGNFGGFCTWIGGVVSRLDVALTGNLAFEYDPFLYYFCS